MVNMDDGVAGLRSAQRADSLGSRVRKLVFSDGSFLDDAQLEDDNREILRLLRLPTVPEKLEGLKRLIAQMSVGRDVSSFFPTVVINIACPSFEVKNLVYIYLVRYAEHRPDEALLSVNSFQKDLQHPNPRVRALALRVLSSIRVPVIVPVVVLAIRRCAGDPSPAVRKAAAHAVPKMWRMDRAREEELVEVVEALLRDAAPPVLSSAVAAFLELCPHRLDLLHRHYRKLCCLLVDTDEWGQTLLAALLLRYARTQFAPPDALRREPLPGDAEAEAPPAPPAAALVAHSPVAAARGAVGPGAPEKGLQALLRSSGEGFYDEEKAAEAEEGKEMEGEEPAAEAEAEEAPEPAAPAAPPGPPPLDEDHRLVLRCSRPLLQSRNAGVVLAVAALHWYLAPAAELPRVARALAFATRSSPEAAHALLHSACAMAQLAPQLFTPHLAAFFPAPRDSTAVRGLKLELLSRCAGPNQAERLLTELQLSLRDATPAAAVLAVRAVGRAATRLPACAPACVRSLMELSGHPAEEVAAEAVVVLRALIQRRPGQHAGVVVRLIRRLEQLRAPAARAAVVWLAAWQPAEDGPAPADAPPADAAAAAEAAEKLAALAPHALRLVLRSYTSEAECVKLALLGAAAKLTLRDPAAPLPALLYAHCAALAALDPSYDVRDRARALAVLLPPGGVPPDASLAAHVAPLLLCAKPAPPLPSPAPLRSGHTLGTLSHLVQHTAPGYLPLPPHPDVPPPSSVRAPPPRPAAPMQPRAPTGRAAPVKQGGKGAEDFYSESETSSYTETDEEEEEEEEEETDEDDAPAVVVQNDPSEWAVLDGPPPPVLEEGVAALELGEEERAE